MFFFPDDLWLIRIAALVVYVGLLLFLLSRRRWQDTLDQRLWLYIGLALIAYRHSMALQHVQTAAMVSGISQVVLGHYGALFVCACVFLACLATATALTEVSTVYFYEMVFREAIPKNVCLITILIVMVAMSVIGFNGIMRLALPILNYLYPCLILLCFYNLGHYFIVRKHR